MSDVKTFKIKHIGCCGDDQVTEIEGATFTTACINFMRECFNDGDECTIDFFNEENFRKRYVISKHKRWEFNIDEEF